MIDVITSTNLANHIDTMQMGHCNILKDEEVHLATKAAEQLTSKMQQFIQQILSTPVPNNETTVKNLKYNYENNRYKINYQTLAQNIILEFE